MLDTCRGKAAARAVGRNVFHRKNNFGLLLLVWLVSLTSLKTETATSDCLTQSSSKVRPGAVALCTTSPQRSGATCRLRRERIVARKAVNNNNNNNINNNNRKAVVAAARGRGHRTATELPQQGDTTAATIEAATGRNASAAAAVRCADVQSATAAPGTGQGLFSDVHLATLPRIALLIDGDQVGKNAFTLILDSLRQCGQLVDRRAYLSKHLAQTLDEDLTRHQIRPVIVLRHAGGTKSPEDMEIAMDVLELCKQSQGNNNSNTNNINNNSNTHNNNNHNNNNIEGVAIASNDLDLLEVLERAQSEGMKVWLCMRAQFSQSGISPLARRAAADAGVEIIVYGQRNKKLPKMVSLISIFDGLAKAHGIRPVHDDLRSLADLESLSLSLMQYGYLSANQVATATLEGAVAKFFHVNKLGPLIIDPITIGWHQCLAAFQNNTSATWSTNPGNLIYVRPRGRRGYKWGTIIAQGPFIIQDSTQLVPEILDRLGYSSPELNFQQTIDMFWDSNIGSLKRRGISAAIVDGSQKLETLEREFRLDLPQDWHPPRSDSSLL
ncbi:unnamed protein product [Polarella glacialis]|uniref:Uncharacterized protein n=1 Tax=Polarella glacialis TaxID=89957 RepID=A0A813I4A9_POLGL|nr:unnamed protein product [Polarella glacialis]